MDSILVQVGQTFGTFFGVPPGWLAAMVPVVVGQVNTFKALFPSLVTTPWYPVIAAIVSFICALYLYPDWSAVIVGALTLWAMQWLTWIGMKAAAVRLGARDK